MGGIISRLKPVRERSLFYGQKKDKSSLIGTLTGQLYIHPVSLTGLSTILYVGIFHPQSSIILSVSTTRGVAANPSDISRLRLWWMIALQGCWKLFGAFWGRVAGFSGCVQYCIIHIL